MSSPSTSPASEIVKIVDASGTTPPTTPTKRGDLEFGTRSEITNHEVLEQFLQTTLNRKGGYSVFDFENPTKTVYVELKTRRIRHDTYDTALIGLNKIQFCESESGVQYWFAYCYTDGIYVIKYDRDLFADFEVRTNYYRGARADSYNGPSSVVLIPVKHLTKVDPATIFNTPIEEKPAVGGAGGPSE